jgi:glycine C-acetyltransferase/8-amino-7-oxononanoate synthase
MIEPEPLQFRGRNEVLRGRRRLVYFSGCDYFRLARDPRIARAAIAALRRYGVNVAASRRTTGNHKIYALLERELEKFFAAESALVLPDGYFAPAVAAQALAAETTHVFVDEFGHGALQDAARMFGGRAKEFKHRNPEDLGRQLAACKRGSRPIVLTDGMFPHDGSVAPLGKYLDVLPAGGWLLVDDAHGAGVLGATGKGSLEHEGVDRRRIIQCGTLSKAFGVYGGFVLASRAMREEMLQRSRLFAGTTPLPPPLAGAALAALKLLRREPGKRSRLRKNVEYLRTRLRATGWEIAETPGPIVRLPELDDSAVNELKTRLLAAGIYPPFLKYGQASAKGVFRFVVASEHTRGQLDTVAAALTTPQRR